MTLSRPTGLRLTTGNGYIFLVWDKQEDENLKGYNLYYSSTSGRYLQRRPLGNVNQYEMDHLQNGQTYYLAITAYDNYDRESDYSDEVRVSVGDANSASAPILISREDYLNKVPNQPQNGPAVLLWITLIAGVLGFGMVKMRTFKI